MGDVAEVSNKPRGPQEKTDPLAVNSNKPTPTEKTADDVRFIISAVNVVSSMHRRIFTKGNQAATVRLKEILEKYLGPSSSVKLEEISIDEDIRNKIIYFYPDITDKNSKLHNVVASLPGRVGSRQKVIICAHFDSVGEGIYDQIAPGANDNASGVAALLCIAKNLKPYSLPFNVEFVLFNGEERFTLGSSSFAGNIPDKNASSVLLVINLDTLGGNKKDRLIVAGNRQAEGIVGLFSACNKKMGIVKELETSNEKIVWGDHLSFTRLKIPAVVISENYSATETRSYPGNRLVHTSFDTAEGLNYKSIAGASELVLGVLQGLSPCDILPPSSKAPSDKGPEIFSRQNTGARSCLEITEPKNGQIQLKSSKMVIKGRVWPDDADLKVKSASDSNLIKRGPSGVFEIISSPIIHPVNGPSTGGKIYIIASYVHNEKEENISWSIPTTTKDIEGFKFVFWGATGQLKDARLFTDISKRLGIVRPRELRFFTFCFLPADINEIGLKLSGKAMPNQIMCLLDDEMDFSDFPGGLESSVSSILAHEYFHQIQKTLGAESIKRWNSLYDSGKKLGTWSLLVDSNFCGLAGGHSKQNEDEGFASAGQAFIMFPSTFKKIIGLLGSDGHLKGAFKDEDLDRNFKIIFDTSPDRAALRQNLIDIMDFIKQECSGGQEPEGDIR